jgi:hypothetical protein
MATTETTKDWQGNGLHSATSGRQRPAEVFSTQMSRRRQAIAGDVRQVPGATTVNGSRGIADAVRQSLERVRKSIRLRANGKS